MPAARHFLINDRAPDDEGPVAKRNKRKDTVKEISPTDATREALDFCFEDVSSLRMIGAAPLNDLTSGPGPGAASGADRARRRGGAQRWNLVVLGLLILTLAATTAVTLLGR
jgi:hypothetical protein